MPLGRPSNPAAGGTHSYESEAAYALHIAQLRQEFESLPERARKSKLEDVVRALYHYPLHYAKNSKGERIRVKSPLERIAADVYGVTYEDVQR